MNEDPEPGQTRRRPLARLDDRLVPRLGGALRGVGSAGRRTAGVTGRPGRLVARGARRYPTVTAAVLSVVIAAALLLATGGDVHHAVGPAGPSASQLLPGDILGPTAGAPVSTYLQTAQQRLKAVAAAGSTPVTAVVDLTGYLTAAAVESELNGLDDLQVIRAFVSVAPPAAGDVHTVTLEAGSDLAADLGLVKAQAAELVANYRKVVAIAKANPGSTARTTATAYADEAQQAKVDATGIGPETGCVFALVVTGPVGQLEQLARQPDVRVLDPAPPAVPQQSLMIVPLEPQVTDTVEPLTFAGS